MNGGPRDSLYARGRAGGRPGQGDLVDPLVMSLASVFAGLVLRVMAIAELWIRLRWRERQLRTGQAYVSGLARSMPDGCSLSEVRADGSELHLAVSARGRAE